MASSIMMYISLVTISGVVTLFLCCYTYLKRKEIPGALSFILYTLTQSIYIFAVAFEMTSGTLIDIKRWTAVQYIGMAPSTVFGLIVVLQYIGKVVSRKVTALLLVVPVISIVMVATNDYHHLYYRSMTYRDGASLPLTEIVIGQFYVLHGAYTFGCMLAAIMFLVKRWRQTKKTYRLQLVTLIAGQFIPMLGSFVYLIGLIPYDLDPVPILLCVTSAMYIWAIISTRMLTIVPIAKESIFESMADGVIVLDNADRLIDFNGAAGRMLPGLSSNLIGVPLDQAYRNLGGGTFPMILLSETGQAEMKWETEGDTAYYYHIRRSVVRGRFGEIIGSLLMLIDVTEQRRLQEQLKQLAYHDGMTKLLNRTAFIQRSKELLSEALEKSVPVTVVLFDIDHFKSINDTYGHETGDFAIQHVAELVKMILQPETLFARYGGEEFVICLPSYDLAEGAALAEVIRSKLNLEPLQVEGATITITASFGVSQSGGGAEETMNALLKNADLALYKAKRGGRNQVRQYEPLVTV